MSYPGQIHLPAQDPDIARARQVNISDEQMQTIRDAAGGNPQRAMLMENLLRTENRGFGYPNNNAGSNKGAIGAWQMTPKAWLDYGVGDFSNARDFKQGAAAAAKAVQKAQHFYGDNPDPGLVGAFYNAGKHAADVMQVGGSPPSAETEQYAHIMRGLSEPEPRLTGTDILSK
jgi:hypothetical protein